MLRAGRGRVSRRLVRLGRDRPAGLNSALRAAGLPADDIRPDVAAFFQLEEAGEALGWAALERHGDDALLRSVLVAPAHRRGGIGKDLVGRVAGEAAAAGIVRLWLLTEGAAPFFAKLGFVIARREDAPEAIRQTSEFAGVCPGSAACMTLALAR